MNAIRESTRLLLTGLGCLWLSAGWDVRADEPGSDVAEMTQEVLSARMIDEIQSRWSHGKGWALQRLLADYARRGVSLDSVRGDLSVEGSESEILFANRVLRESGFRNLRLTMAEKSGAAPAGPSSLSLKRLTPLFVFSAAVAFGVLQVAYQRSHSTDAPLASFKVEMIPYLAFASASAFLEWQFLHASDFWDGLHKKYGSWPRQLSEGFVPLVSASFATVVASFPGLKASYDGFDPKQLALVGGLSIFGLMSSQLVEYFVKQGRWTLSEAERIEASYSMVHRVLRVMAMMPFMHQAGLALQGLFSIHTTGRLYFQRYWVGPKLRQSIALRPKGICSRALSHLIF